MHYFSVGVRSLCLNVSMQVSKHLELRQIANYWFSIIIMSLIEHSLLDHIITINLDRTHTYQYHQYLIIMSLVQIAYQTLLTKLRDWSRLQSKQQLEVLQQASSLFGQPLRSALNLIQKNAEKVQIYEYDHFYLMIINLQKYLLFKSNSKARLNDCTCKSSWLRKVGQKAPYLCFHQIVLELCLSLFPNQIIIQKINCNGTAELAQYLQAIE